LLPREQAGPPILQPSHLADKRMTACSHRWHRHGMISLLGLFATEKDRRLAREQALYALEDHGDAAESCLAAKARQAQKRSRRRIYQLAIEEVRRLTGR